MIYLECPYQAYEPDRDCYYCLRDRDECVVGDMPEKWKKCPNYRRRVNGIML